MKTQGLLKVFKSNLRDPGFSYMFSQRQDATPPSSASEMEGKTDKL